GEGAGSILCLADGHRIALAAQRAIQAGQVGTLAVIGFHPLLAELLAQQIGQFGERNDMAAVVAVPYEVTERQHFTGYDHQQQFILTRLAAATGSIQMGAHADHRGERLGGFALGRMEHAGDVTVGGPGPGKGAIVTTQDIGGEGTYLLAAAPALGGFVLPGVVVEQVVVGGGHQCLQGIGGGGLAGAVAAGVQSDRAVFHFLDRQVAPVGSNRAFQIHAQLAPSARSAASSIESSSSSATPPPSRLRAVSVTRLMMPGRMISQLSPSSMEPSPGLRSKRSWRMRRSSA